MIRAQSVSTQMGGRCAGLAYASATLSDEWSLLNNPAGIAGVRETKAASAYDLRPALPGADRMASIIVSPFLKGTAGGGFFRFGDDIYNEQMIVVGFAHSIGITSLGGRLAWTMYHAAGFGILQALSASAGGRIQLTPEIIAAAWIENINQPRLGSERLPTVMTIGAAFRPDDRVSIMTEIQKDLAYETTFRAALEYIPHRRICFRTGVSLHPDFPFFGLGLRLKFLNVDYAANFSPALSTSHHISITIKSRKNHEG